jgi:hypothetical protein
MFEFWRTHRRTPKLIAIFVPVMLWQSVAARNRDDEPEFSARATTIYAGKRVSSPDKTKNVHIEPLRAALSDSPGNFPARLIVETESGQLSATFGFALSAELIWSPDSDAFSLTGSGEGGNGQYRTDVFLIRENKLIAIHLTNIIEKEFGHPVKCGWPELPNVAPVKWLSPSGHLLVAAEIVHHSNCDSFGTFKLYEVNLEGSYIVRKYNQLQAKRLFRTDLGPELLQADDKCIRDPKSCRVNFNWQ